MSNELMIRERSPVAEIEETQNLVRELLKTKHYQKLGEVGVFAIVQKAKSIGMNLLDALNGGIYYLPNGVLEITAMTMNMLIRAAGHSISKDPKSNSQICILHGKRKDNGDTWVSSFSIEDAKKADIFKNTWHKYPEDMMFARALSRLARQLFPDVIKGCYVKGEVSEADHETLDVTFNEMPREAHQEIKVEPEANVSRAQLNEIIEHLKECPQDYQQSFLKTADEVFNGIANIPVSKFHATMKKIKQNKVPPEEHPIPEGEQE